ncbi:MAG: hypothetical protein RRB13_07065 [bacterium]|nr:hypothetical protein [bacterium]
MQDLEAENPVFAKGIKGAKGQDTGGLKFKKSHLFSICISDSDLDAIQFKATKSGIPYQTINH